MRIALTLAILVALGSTARAEDTVGVVPDGDGALQPQLQAQIADWLTRHGHTVMAAPFPPEAVAQFTDQMKTGNPSNARDVFERSATAGSVVYARAEARKGTGSRDVTVTVAWLVKGHDVTSQQKDCDRCTDQLLRATIDELLKKLLGGGAVGHVKLKSSPPGARITIDGQAIGITPLDWDLPTGKHSITMDKAGLKAASRDVVVTSDKTELLVLTLDPPDADAGGGSGKLLPVSVLAVGGALLAAGVVMIAIDEDPDPNKPTYRDTGPTGIGLAIGGAAVAGVGGYLLYRSHRQSTPVAAVSHDGAFIGWAGRF
jgi:hypothetical protein